MHFIIKSENFFDKCMTVQEIIRNIITKQFNRGLIYNKKYLKAEKRFKTKESFLYFFKQNFYIPVIIFYSVYRKDENYYLKVLLQKFIHNFFWRNIRDFDFQGFGSFS